MPLRASASVLTLSERRETAREIDSRALDNIFDMAQWTIVIVTGSIGREIRGLSPGHLADFLRIGELLCRYGPQEVGMPHVRPVGDKLWEMRLRAGGIARAIYFTTSCRRIVVLHAF